ncbi:MAG: response regulator, partial [Acidobacteria bacterium]|nr:response regulator [Acidobacteriota bacterium]
MSPPPTLLLADDSVAIQRVMTLTFADQPVRLVVARDGQDAINRMATERPDLVLADTNMPCVDGYALARWVRQQPHLSAVPVLLLTGVTELVDEQRLHDSGANGVLEKPFEPSHVISRVKELLGMKGAPPVASTRLVTSVEPRVPARPATPAPPDAAPPPARPSGRLAAPSRRDRVDADDDAAESADRASFSTAALDAASSETADAFESLLAAELDDTPGKVSASGPAAGDDLVPDAEGERVLDMLASRVAERLAPEALRDEAVHAVAG